MRGCENLVALTNGENTMKKTITALAMVLSMGVVGAPAMADSDDTIKIPMNSWTGQNLSARIMGDLLSDAGYSVEYVTAGAVPQLTAMAQGELHVQPEFWTNNVGDIYDKAVADGDIVIVGPLGLEPQEGWVYPPYMEERCPGLPDYKALYDCAEAFTTADTFPKGRLITYPADWGTRSKDLVERIGLPFEPVAGGSEGAMIAEIKGAIAAEEPILIMMWQPHWIFAEEELRWVKWNGDGVNCDEENQTRDNACGFQQAEVVKLVSGNFQDKWPQAYEFVQKYTLSNDIQNDLILEVDQKGASVEEAARAWIEANPDTWKPWVEGLGG